MKQQETNNIEHYRRKKRKKIRVKRLVVFLLILIVAVGSVVVASVFDFSNIGSWFSSSGDDGSFPRQLIDDNPSSFSASEGNLELVTNSKIYRYNASGSLVYTSPHNFTTPASTNNGKYTMLYSVGGYSFRVDNQSETLFKKEVTNKVLCGAIASNGSVAVATSEDRYTSSVTVYNTFGDQTYKWYSSGEQVLSMEFFPNGNGVAVACVGAENGRFYSRIYYLDFSVSDESEIANLKLYDTMVLEMMYQSNGQLCVVGENRVVFVDGRGEQVAEYAYTSTLKRFAFMDNGTPVLLLESYDSSALELLVAVGSDGKVLNSLPMQQESVDLVGGPSGVAVLSQKTVYYFDASLTKKAEVEVGLAAKKICVIGSELYVLSLSEISQYQINS